MPAKHTLESGVAALGLALVPAQIQQLHDYQALLRKWGKVYNLTALHDAGDILTHHVLDSLAAVAPLQRHLRSHGWEQSPAGAGAQLLDVGSGAGLPGVVFAVCCPHLRVTCVDAVAKKATFIRQAALTLGLTNLTALHARVETITQPFDIVSSRAFAALADFTAWSQAALAPQGVWLAMKAKPHAEELAALPTNLDVFHVEPLQVPGLDAQRCLVWLRRR